MACLAENWAFNLRMTYGEKHRIWQADDWPNWRYDLSALTWPLTEVSRAQGLLLGRLADVGLALRDQASLAALTEDVVKTSEIEGEVLNVESVRSSIARRLGVDIGAVAPVDRNVEGVVEMVLDATSHAAAPLSTERLWGWHAALFPTGYSGMDRIAVGQWREDADGPMQVVSGPVGRRGGGGGGRAGGGGERFPPGPRPPRRYPSRRRNSCRGRTRKPANLRS